MASDKWQRMVTGALCAAVFAVAALAQSERVELPFGEAPFGQDVEQPAATSAVAVAEARQLPPTGAIDVQADRLTYDRETGWMEATGHVIILNGADKLTADYVQVNMETQQAMATGNVVLERPSGVTRGERLTYDFRAQQGRSDALSGEAKPFFWVAESTEQASTNRFVLHDAEVTTCRYHGKHRHFHVWAKDLTIVPNEWMKAHHAVWFFGRVPAFYAPYWFRSLKETGCGWSFQPGYDSRKGVYLLSTYGCMPWPWLKTETHVDYYTQRGLGLGQDFRWHQSGSAWSGDLELYEIDDKDPWEPEEDPTLSNVDPQRYRVRLRNRYTPDRNSYMLMQGYYLSDPDVQEDFFESEYKRGRQPENYLTYTRRGDGYMVNLNVRKRLNDFYTTLERLPEVSVDVFRREIGDSRVYYEGRAAAGYLQLTFQDDSANEDYSALRGDTFQRLYRPFRLFGFLNMIPRVGYRGTWYSETKPPEPVVTEVVQEDGTIQQVVEKTEDAGPSGVRSLYEVGQEISFKAFRIWDNVGAGQRTYRHIVEPFVDYTYVANSGLTPDDTYQFDRVDRYGEAHYAKFGVRNMLQTKQDDRARDVVDLDMYTVYDLDLDPGEDPINDVYFDAKILPRSGMRVDFDARYNVPASEFGRVNTRLWLWRSKMWSLAVENRYRKENNNLWTIKADWRPNNAWRFGSNMRYDLEDKGLELIGGYVRHDYDCIVLKTGGEFRPGYLRSDGSEQEDEYRVTIEFWLKAFPTTKMKIR